MAHTDLTTCNKALDRERVAQEEFVKWAEYQIAEYRKEARELLLKADGIQEALNVSRNKRKIS
jgi:hypothetical protein